MFEMKGQKIEIMAAPEASDRGAAEDDFQELCHWMGDDRAREADIIVWGEDLARIPIVALKDNGNSGQNEGFTVVWAEPSVSSISLEGYCKAATLIVRAVEIDNGVAAAV